MPSLFLQCLVIVWRSISWSVCRVKYWKNGSRMEWIFPHKFHLNHKRQLTKNISKFFTHIAVQLEKSPLILFKKVSGFRESFFFLPSRVFFVLVFIFSTFFTHSFLILHWSNIHPNHSSGSLFITNYNTTCFYYINLVVH